MKWFLTRLCYLAVIATFFYASYGFANYFAAMRQNVPEIFFSWERQIPFWAWSIVPYWSLNLLYGFGFLLCKSKAELRCYTLQLFLAQIVASAFFILTPLQISWQKPESSGFFGFLFDSLLAFDKPFNQAPSLHIILSVIVGSLYMSKARQIWLKCLLFVWFALIVVSVLTTFQHHFIDIPTGLLVGFLVLLFVPLDGEILKPKRNFVTPRHLKQALIYGFFAVLSLFVALAARGWALWLVYISVSFFLVALAYLLFGCEIFRKGQNGRLQTAAKILLLPYLLVARVNIFYWLRHDSLYDEIIPGIYLGSIVAAPKFSAIFDLTAECEYRPRNAQIYENFALLDMTQPSLIELCSAAAKFNELASLGKRTLVCCALGYGRSAVVLAAWLTRYKNFSVQEAIDLIKSSRKMAVIEGYEDLLQNFKKELKC